MQYNKAYHSSNIDAAICQVGYGLSQDTDFVYSFEELQARFIIRKQEFADVIKLNPHFRKRTFKGKELTGGDIERPTKYSKECFRYLKANFEQYACWS